MGLGGRQTGVMGLEGDGMEGPDEASGWGLGGYWCSPARSVDCTAAQEPGTHHEDGSALRTGLLRKRKILRVLVVVPVLQQQMCWIESFESHWGVRSKARLQCREAGEGRIIHLLNTKAKDCARPIACVPP